MREIIGRALEVAGLRRPIIPGLAPLIKLMATPLTLLPEPPLTPDAVDFINQPAVVDTGPLLARMPRRLTPLDEGLASYLHTGVRSRGAGGGRAVDRTLTAGRPAPARTPEAQRHGCLMPFGSRPSWPQPARSAPEPRGGRDDTDLRANGHHRGDRSGARASGHLVELIDLSLHAKQAHWNVVGPSFKPVHEFLDELADAYRDWYDLVAERLTAIGVSPDGRAAIVAGSSPLPPMPAGPISDTAALAALDERVTLIAANVRDRASRVGHGTRRARTCSSRSCEGWRSSAGCSGPIAPDAHPAASDAAGRSSRPATRPLDRG